MPFLLGSFAAWSAALSLLLSPFGFGTVAAAPMQPHEQTFVLTAYYSPVPGQCCYVKGSLADDIVLNGQGIRGADGTAVYPGMIAAPSSYAFGTRVVLPGFGTFTVHDRGGAIQEQDSGHRLDIWMGHGEEGLARALAFGKQTVRGIVYPLGTAQPGESVSLSDFDVKLSVLKPYLVDPSKAVALIPSARYGERGDVVSDLQTRLKDAGYFAHEVTGFYGDVTRASVTTFLADMGLSGDGTEVAGTGAVFLEVATTVPAREESVPLVGPESTERELMAARRLLRGLGYYRGRTAGIYDRNTADAIVAFQRDQKLVADAQSPGAGRIGPKTRVALARVVRKARIAKRVEKRLAQERVRTRLAEKKQLIAGTLSEGMKGATVAALQRVLASAGLFPSDQASGFFGPLTREAVLAFQLKHKLVKYDKESGAGRVGPATLAALQDVQIRSGIARVEGFGWDAL